MIEVINHNTYSLGCVPPGEYIGRAHRDYPCASPLANPFKMGADGTRREVIAKFKQRLWQQMCEGGPMNDELNRLVELARRADLRLICFCAPLACHGEVIKAAIEWRMKEKR